MCNRDFTAYISINSFDIYLISSVTYKTRDFKKYKRELTKNKYKTPSTSTDKVAAHL